MGADRRGLAALAALLLAAATPAAAREACAGGAVTSPGWEAQAAAGRASLERALADDNGSGIQVAVVRDGRLIWSEGIGVAGPGRPLTPRTRLRIASVSKLFTATAAARLAVQGRLDLDAPVQAYVPEFPAKRGAVTARRLASHTGGVRQYDFAKLSEGNNATRYATLTAAMQVYANDPLAAEPGAAVLYSSLGFNLLGVVVERAAGRPYGAALEALVTRPLGLRRTGLDDVQADVPCRSQFFTIVAGKTRTPAPKRENSDYYPSGGLLSTAEDLARLADATYRGRGVTPAMRRLLSTPVPLADGRPGDYALGWQARCDPQGRVLWYGSGGNTNGAYASLRWYPATRTSIAVISNYNLWGVAPRPAVLRAAREELPGVFGAEVD